MLPRFPTGVACCSAFGGIKVDRRPNLGDDHRVRSSFKAGTSRTIRGPPPLWPWERSVRPPWLGIIEVSNPFLIIHPPCNNRTRAPERCALTLIALLPDCPVPIAGSYWLLQYRPPPTTLHAPGLECRKKKHLAVPLPTRLCQHRCTILAGVKGSPLGKDLPAGGGHTPSLTRSQSPRCSTRAGSA